MRARLLIVLLLGVVVALLAGCSGDGPMPTGLQGGYWYTVMATEDGNPVAMSTARDWSDAQVATEQIYFISPNTYRRVFVKNGVEQTPDNTTYTTSSVDASHWNVTLPVTWPTTAFQAEVLPETPGVLTTTYTLGGHTYVVNWWRTDW